MGLEEQSSCSDALSNSTETEEARQSNGCTCVDAETTQSRNAVACPCVAPMTQACSASQCCRTRLPSMILTHKKHAVE